MTALSLKRWIHLGFTTRQAQQLERLDVAASAASGQDATTARSRVISTTATVPSNANGTALTFSGITSYDGPDAWYGVTGSGLPFPVTLPDPFNAFTFPAGYVGLVAVSAQVGVGTSLSAGDGRLQLQIHGNDPKGLVEWQPGLSTEFNLDMIDQFYGQNFETVQQVRAFSTIAVDVTLNIDFHFMELTTPPA